MSFQKIFVIRITISHLFLFAFVSHAVAASQFSVNTTSINFGAVNVGSSAQQQVKITNSASATIAIRAVSVSGNYFATSNPALPVSLRSGASATFAVMFTPHRIGPQTGKIVIESSTGQTLNVSLAANGAEDGISIVPSTVSFSSLPVGSSNSQTFTITNSRAVPVSISSGAISEASFNFAGLTNALTIQPGHRATFNIVFRPTAPGKIAATAPLFCRSTGSQTTTLAIAVAGTATGATGSLLVSPSSLSFGNVKVGQNASFTLKLSNTGNSKITVSRAAITGAGFGLSGGLSGLTLEPGQSDSVAVVFGPASAGAASGTVSIVAGATTTSVKLSGSGSAPSSSHTVSLSWDASDSTNIAGYMVERGTAPGGPYQPLTSPISGTAFVDSTVQNGREYFYVIISVASGGQQSQPSEQVGATIPSS